VRSLSNSRGESSNTGRDPYTDSADEDTACSKLHTMTALLEIPETPPAITGSGQMETPESPDTSRTSPAIEVESLTPRDWAAGTTVATTVTQEEEEEEEEEEEQ